MLGTFVSLTLSGSWLGACRTVIVGQAGFRQAQRKFGSNSRNSEQIDDSRLHMGTIPSASVTPSIFAALIVFPILTVILPWSALAGGYLSGSALIGWMAVFLLVGGSFGNSARRTFAMASKGACSA